MSHATKRIDPAQAKTLLKLVSEQRNSVLIELKKTKQYLARGHGTAAVQKSAHQAIAQLQVQEKKLALRIAALKLNTDILEAPKLDPNQVSHQRPKLDLPRAYSVPSQAIVSSATKIIAQIVPQSKGETSTEYKIRKQAILHRSMARTVIKQAEYPQKSTPEVMQEAIKDAIVKDAPIIAEEIQAGGLVPDAAAEAMAPVTESAAPAAAESMMGKALLGAGVLALGGWAARKKGWI